MEIRRVKYGTDEYNETLKIRDKVLRRPSNKSIYDDDLSDEENKDILFGAFDDKNLLGVITLSIKTKDIAKIRFLAVDTELQRSGVGSKLINYIENYALEKGYKELILEARCTAKGFYLKHGYETVGEVYIPSHIHVEHIEMKKSLGIVDICK